MERYIEQLLNDIKAATWNIQPPNEIWDSVDMNNEAEIEDISYVEEYIYGEEQPVSEITTIDQEKLPPDHKLTDNQKAILAEALEKLLNHFNFHLDFPENYPNHLRYSFIYDIWGNSYVPLSFGQSHIEFCDYEQENCPFSGYCSTCADIQREIDEGPHADEDDFNINPEDLLPKF